MSETNGNGKADVKTPRPDLFHGASLIPGNPGNSGGKPGRSGRTPSAIRAKYREALWRNIPWLQRVASGQLTKAEKAEGLTVTLADRKWAIELLNRYGVPVQTAATDGDGNDVPPLTAAGADALDAVLGRLARVALERGADGDPRGPGAR